MDASLRWDLECRDADWESVGFAPVPVPALKDEAGCGFRKVLDGAEEAFTCFTDKKGFYRGCPGGSVLAQMIIYAQRDKLCGRREWMKWETEGIGGICAEMGPAVHYIRQRGRGNITKAR